MPILAVAAALAATGAPAGGSRAIELFEREAVLMDWALKHYDCDRDGRLSPTEAQAAADAFRSIADGDGDGRVTPYEYARALEFIVARYAIGS